MAMFIFEEGKAYDVSYNTPDSFVLVREDGCFSSIPDGTLMSDAMKDDFKPLDINKWRPVHNSSVRCVNTNPLTFVGSMEEVIKRGEPEKKSFFGKLSDLCSRRI